jgi:flagellar FliL protein
MADEQKETPTTEGEAEAPAKPGKLPLIGGIVGGLVIGAVVGFMVLGPKLSPASGAPKKDAHGEAAKDEKGGEHGEKKAEKSIYQIDNMVLNPSGSNGTRFLLLSVALEVKDEATLTMIKGRDAELRDMILRFFGAKTAEQVADASTREALRAELIAALNKTFPAGSVQKVFFPQFVIQ